MRKILTVALAGVLAATMLFAGCSKKEESKIPEKIIVGTNAEFPPFEYVDDNKKVDGFDIALMKEIAKRMDKKIEIQNMEFKSLIGSMEKDHQRGCSGNDENRGTPECSRFLRQLLYIQSGDHC